MTGVQFIVNDQGEKTAVVIDLEQKGALWEDFYDLALARERKGEPRESREEVRRQLLSQGKLEDA